ncbi:glutamate receptor 2.2-like [Hevea brasiliensis]|nr:glutamate receptor 2.2-like [Hevea brasiliensis]
MRNKSYPSKPVFPFIFLFILTILFVEIAMAKNTKVSVDVGVVLDLDNKIGKIGLSCINLSLSDFYAKHSHYKTRLVLHARDSKNDVVGAAAAALDLLKNVEVKAIIGPATSMQANFVIELGEKVRVPIITFSASSPSLASTRSPYFFRATRSDSSQMNAISAIVKAFGWREAVPVYIDNEYGVGIIPYLTDSLQAVDTQVPYRSAISPFATDDQILKELLKLKAMQTRVFIVHMSLRLGSMLFTMAKKVGMMGKGYVWIMTDGVADFLNSMDYSVIESMQGVLGVKPYVPRSKSVENFRVQWKRKFHHDHPDLVDAELNIYGLWAYDATIALAMAIERVAGTMNFGFRKGNISSNSTDLETLGVSQIGPSLRQALSNTRFKGLTGDFLFINGQLNSSTFQIVNVDGNGDGARRVGFWVTGKGLVKRLKSATANTSKNSSSNNNSTTLSTIIWPGDTAPVPKGWEIPTNGKKLRIGVPVKEGFTQFVNVTRYPGTNASKVEGYCIDLFDAVVAELPYAVTYEYVPFANPDGNSAGTYNELIHHVSLRTFDAAVGDISIVANRSLEVDFTLPYMESGRVSMIVPIIDDESMKAWVFLKPLTWDLWVTSLVFFIFIGFVVWVLEHRINEDFRGPPSHQASTGFWFSFSTMVFAHREKVVSNLGRIVVIIWCFVGLILTQSYTASLSSFLTLQQFQPTFTTIDELIKKGDFVGYQNGSFVKETLKSLGFDESKLVPYKSAEDCDQLLSKGSKNGGVAAAFEGPTSIHLILAQNCSKYTLVEPASILEAPRWKNISNIQEFNTDGLGFAFPKGSPLVPDVSRAILKVTEGDKIKEIWGKWFGEMGTCPDRSNSVPSNRLGLNSFWGLFLIAGITSCLALIIYFGMFIYQNRGVLKPFDTRVSMRSRILDLLKIFNQKDFKSHAFKKSIVDDGSGITVPVMGEPSPSSNSINTDFHGEQGTPSAEDVYHNQNELTFCREEALFIEHSETSQGTFTAIELACENY